MLLNYLNTIEGTGLIVTLGSGDLRPNISCLDPETYENNLTFYVLGTLKSAHLTFSRTILICSHSIQLIREPVSS